MGVLVATGDKLAVKRTAEFFLKSFQERLEEQKKERQAKGEQSRLHYECIMYACNLIAVCRCTPMGALLHWLL